MELIVLNKKEVSWETNFFQSAHLLIHLSKSVSIPSYTHCYTIV
jgi:hypothetical protein